MAADSNPTAIQQEQKRLEVFIGNWILGGQTKDGRTVAITGTESYEWMPGGLFLIHKLDVRLGADDYHAHEIIGYDTEKQQFTINSFDSWGQRDSYHATVNGDTWTYSGKSRRGNVVFSDDSSHMTADWQMSFNGTDWQPWMDVKSTRAG